MLVKLLFHLIVAVILCSSQLTPQTEDEWWHGFGDWDTPASLQSNPFYQTQQYLQNQMDLFGFAQHVGKINRGQIFNPELNSPMNHAYGYQNDFNDEDFTSGAFRNPSKGQMIRATQAHVDRGLAKAVGEIAVMPVGTNVQPDGTILVQTSTRQKNPCEPNPCSRYKMSQCDVINGVTAKCSQHGNYELTLRWDEDYHDMYFYIDAAYHDGSDACDGDAMYDDESGCGVEVGPNTAADHTAGVYVAEQDALFTQLDDGTKYQDYTYQVLAYYNSYNPSSSNGELVISYEGEVKQIVKIPQYHGVDYVNNPARSHYFFGCFRPYAGGYYLDTNGAGFYGKNVDLNVPGPDDEYVIGDFGIFDDGLCNALRKWTGAAGYNHNDDQAGSDEG